tara:strand:- start:79 stop:378 length:300 start_codon:yes stop_codon:yes gene_type:complete
VATLGCNLDECDLSGSEGVIAMVLVASVPLFGLSDFRIDLPVLTHQNIVDFMALPDHTLRHNNPGSLTGFLQLNHNLERIWLGWEAKKVVKTVRNSIRQ